MESGNEKIEHNQRHSRMVSFILERMMERKNLIRRPRQRYENGNNEEYRM